MLAMKIPALLAAPPAHLHAHQHLQQHPRHHHHQSSTQQQQPDQLTAGPSPSLNHVAPPFLSAPCASPLTGASMKSAELSALLTSLSQIVKNNSHRQLALRTQVIASVQSLPDEALLELAYGSRLWNDPMKQLLEQLQINPDDLRQLCSTILHQRRGFQKLPLLADQPSICRQDNSGLTTTAELPDAMSANFHDQRNRDTLASPYSSPNRYPSLLDSHNLSPSPPNLHYPEEQKESSFFAPVAPLPHVRSNSVAAYRPLNKCQIEMRRLAQQQHNQQRDREEVSDEMDESSGDEEVEDNGDASPCGDDASSDDDDSAYEEEQEEEVGHSYSRGNENDHDDENEDDEDDDDESAFSDTPARTKKKNASNVPKPARKSTQSKSQISTKPRSRANGNSVGGRRRKAETDADGENNNNVLRHRVVDRPQFSERDIAQSVPAVLSICMSNGSVPVEVLLFPQQLNLAHVLELQSGGDMNASQFPSLNFSRRHVMFQVTSVLKNVYNIGTNHARSINKVEYEKVWCIKGKKYFTLDGINAEITKRQHEYHDDSLTDMTQRLSRWENGTEDIPEFKAAIEQHQQSLSMMIGQGQQGGGDGGTRAGSGLTTTTITSRARKYQQRVLRAKNRPTNDNTNVHNATAFQQTSVGAIEIPFIPGGPVMQPHISDVLAVHAAAHCASMASSTSSAPSTTTPPELLTSTLVATLSTLSPGELMSLLHATNVRFAAQNSAHPQTAPWSMISSTNANLSTNAHANSSTNSSSGDMDMDMSDVPQLPTLTTPS